MVSQTDRAQTDTARVWDIIEKIDIGMLTTIAGGLLRARPMSSHIERDTNSIFFLTDASGSKDDELVQDPRACLSYSEPKTNTYLSVSGTAAVVRDTPKISALWDKDAEAFWPNGPEDPNIRLIRFQPQRAEFWDGPSSSLVAGLEMLTASATGERPDMGENRKVAF
ncbi:general stress protein [Agaricicola taiwanensis]|uniref:General stress protein n=1 Tax=Agaricicola taiwanensis TaxID=591372 RepID=A0A8J2VJX4_9RHOB|nr:pyridoxamine 5'-phosphate oxidase family protein [Agaricicola taiwanensis]GGE29409.1 general stress protein [Agaricicola taiwanensis]